MEDKKFRDRISPRKGIRSYQAPSYTLHSGNVRLACLRQKEIGERERAAINFNIPSINIRLERAPRVENLVFPRCLRASGVRETISPHRRRFRAPRRLEIRRFGRNRALARRPRFVCCMPTANATDPIERAWRTFAFRRKDRPARWIHPTIPENLGLWI